MKINKEDEVYLVLTTCDGKEFSAPYITDEIIPPSSDVANDDTYEVSIPISAIIELINRIQAIKAKARKP